PVAVLSYGFWKQRLGADPSVIGRTVYLEGVPFTIVGVTPREFFGVMPGRVPAISIPIATERRLDSRSALACSDCGWLRLMARLKPGVSREQARADLSVIFQGLLTREAVEIGDLHQRRIQLEQKLEVDSGGSGLDNLRRQFS